MASLQPSPKVTIGIPTFNRAAYLQEALLSALRQTYANLEIVVSDNGSTDDTHLVLTQQEDPRVVIVEHSENHGMVYNWNSCLSQATGEFFLLLSDDDILEPNAIETLLNGFCTMGTSLSYGPVRNIRETGGNAHTVMLDAPPEESWDSFITRVLSGKTAAFPSATLFRTSDARAVGGYPDIGAAADFGLHLQLVIPDGRVIFNPAPVAGYRVHGGAESYSRRAVASQLSLIEWVRGVSSFSNRHRKQLIRYCTEMVYRWGRYHALRGNREEYLYACSVLRKIAPGSPRNILLRLFNMTIIQRIADVRRAIYRVIWN